MDKTEKSYDSKILRTPRSEFVAAKNKILHFIAQSKTGEDVEHAQRVLKWLLILCPEADEILQLSALSHDAERATPDRLHRQDFKNYNDYKLAHAKRGGIIAAGIAQEVGYSPDDARRLSRIIAAHELESDDAESSLLLDADSIAFFEYNVPFYFKRHGEEKTREKMKFMYDRTSKKARAEIDKILEANSEIKKLFHR